MFCQNYLSSPCGNPDHAEPQGWKWHYPETARWNGSLPQIFWSKRGRGRKNTPYHSTHGEGDYHNVHVQQSVIEEKHKWNLHAEAAGSTNQVFHLMFISCQWAKKKSSNWSKRCEKKNQPKDPRHVPARAELLCVCRWLSHRTPDANSSSALRNQVALIL